MFCISVATNIEQIQKPCIFWMLETNRQLGIFTGMEELKTIQSLRHRVTINKEVKDQDVLAFWVSNVKVLYP